VQAQSYYCVLVEYTGAVSSFGVCGGALWTCLQGNATNVNDTACGTPDTWSCSNVSGGWSTNCSLPDVCPNPNCPWNFGTGHIDCPASTAVYNINQGTVTLNPVWCYAAPTWTSDKYAYGFINHCGTGTFVARIADYNGAAFAGIMIRESNAPGSKMVSLERNESSNLVMRWARDTTNWLRTWQQFMSSSNEKWLRLEKTSLNQVVLSTSSNGSVWQVAASYDISWFNSCLQYGLSAWTLDGNATASVVFDNVSINGENNLCTQ
jgi:hypothetical protein